MGPMGPVGGYEWICGYHLNNPFLPKQHFLQANWAEKLLPGNLQNKRWLKMSHRGFLVAATRNTVNTPNEETQNF